MYTNYFVSGAITDNKIFWCTRDKGDFCFFNLNDEHSKYIYLNNEFIMNQEFSAVVYAKGNIVYGVSEAGKYFWKYIINENKLKMYDIECQGYALDWICNSCMVGDELVIVPSRAEVVLWINTNNGKVFVKNINNEQIKKDHDKRIFINDKLLLGQLTHDGVIDVFRYNEYCFMKIDLKNRNIIKINYPKEIGKIADIEYYDGSYYLINEDGILAKWDVVLDKYEIISEYMPGMERITANNGILWLLPRYIDNIKQFDLKTGEIISEYAYPKNVQLDKSVMYDKYMTNNGYIIENKYIKCCSVYGCNLMFVIDKNRNKGKFYDVFNFESENLKQYYNKYKSEIYYEKSKSLKSFLEYNIETNN